MDDSRQTPTPGTTARALYADVDAQCSALFRTITGKPGPEVDAAGLIARHGLDRVAGAVTHMIMRGMSRVARKRGHLPDETIVEDYLNRLFAHQSDEVRQLVRRQVRHKRHPPIHDPHKQEAFVLGLLAVHAGAVIELAGHEPAPEPGGGDGI